jgi:serine/threonine protein kinase, bacterial
VAVDPCGNVYVVNDSTVVKLAAGSNTQTALPFTGLNLPTDVVVEAADNLYVVDRNNHRVVKLAAGSSTQTVLPFTGLSVPAGVAVDTGGNVYVSDQDNKRVLELAAG